MGIGMLYAFPSPAQDLPKVIGAAGYSGTGVHAWTVGEALVITLDNGLHQITQGFHQPQFYLVGMSDTPSSPEPVAYPNPTSGPLALELPEGQWEEVTVEIISIWGQRLIQKVCPGPQSRIDLDLSLIAGGIYLVVLRSTDGTPIHRFRIEKINP